MFSTLTTIIALIVAYGAGAITILLLHLKKLNEINADYANFKIRYPLVFDLLTYIDDLDLNRLSENEIHNIIANLCNIKNQKFKHLG